MGDDPVTTDWEPTPEDLAEAVALLRQSAIEMYQEQGHDLPNAERLAEELLQSPAQFRLPTIQELDDDVVVIEYEDMTPAQKRIVDAGNEPTMRVPDGLTKEQLEQWLLDTFLKGGTDEPAT